MKSIWLTKSIWNNVFTIKKIIKLHLWLNLTFFMTSIGIDVIFNVVFIGNVYETTGSQLLVHFSSIALMSFDNPDTFSNTNLSCSVKMSIKSL